MPSSTNSVTTNTNITSEPRSQSTSNRGSHRPRGRGRGSSRGRGRGRGRISSTNSYRGRQNRSFRPSSESTNDKKQEIYQSSSTNPLPQLISSSSPEKSDLCTTLSKQLSRGTLECLVCLTPIHRRKPLWSCRVCYTITHLQCARKWARSGPSASSNSNDTAARTNGTNNSSRTQSQSTTTAPSVCPSCRAKIAPSELAYWCFCRRRKSPSVDPGVLPGSCGEICLKPRGVPGSSCSHRCTIPCHPGPCAPCTQPASPRACHCGAELIARRCGERNEPVSCGGLCSIPKACRHPCKRVCHEGDCGDCDEVVKVNCYCGSHSADLLCGVNGYSCGDTCGKKLLCGKHTCQKVCHEGECAPCPLSPEAVTTCPCGKTKLSLDQRASRTSCTSPIPSCQQLCGRKLSCLSGHSCNKICGHEGDCGPCTEIITADCRCGSSDIKVNCGDSFSKLQQLLICDKVCHDRLACRHHSCQTVCCQYKKRRAIQRPGVVHSTILWNNARNLSAAERRQGHACEKKCNRLLACGLHSCDLSCGHTGACPPCGILLREPITCFCGANSLQPPVRCGAPPPACHRPCSKPRPCGHSCPDNCHDGPCPPCVELSRFDCIGRHGESRFVPCHIGAKGIKCHRPCGRSLKCGIHACRNSCHANYPQECEPSQTNGCEQICGLPRSTCGHSCTSLCHPDRMCPETPCKEIVSVKCPCGRREEEAMCLRGGHSSSKGLDGNVRLTCDEECTAFARLRGFASAIGRNETDGNENSQPIYSDFLYQFAEYESDRLGYFENQLAFIVDGKAKKFTVKGLPQLHRLVLHTLSDMYCLDSESSGHGGNREVVVRHRGAGIKPIVPKLLLSQANAIREQERKRLRQSTDLRTLIVHVASSTKYSATMNLEARVENELKSHKGCYRMTGQLPLSTNHMGIAVEFSTLERAEFVRSSLANRSDIVIEKPGLTSKRALDASKQLHQMSLNTSPVTDSWDEGSDYHEQQRIAHTSNQEEIPDSWED